MTFTLKSLKTSHLNHKTIQGVDDFGTDGGLASGFSERYPLLIIKTRCHTHFYDEFWWKMTHFWLFLPISE